MNRRARRHGRSSPPRVVRPAARPRSARGHTGRPRRPRTGWLLPALGALLLLLAALVAVNVWLQSRPPRPETAALHADIVGGKSGAEVTFAAIVLAAPASVGDHEHIQVRDTAGDQLELDYNTSLGTWIPVHSGSHLTVHGQLYVDAGRTGVHCLHSETSRGCPLPGWVQLGGAMYS